MVGHKILDACANAQGAGTRAYVLHAVQGFGALARTVFASAAAAARVRQRRRGRPGQRMGLPLKVTGGGGRQRAHSTAAAPALV